MDKFEYYANDIIMEGISDHSTILKSFKMWYKEFKPKLNETLEKAKEYEDNGDFKNALKTYKEGLAQIKEIRAKISSIPDNVSKKIIIYIGLALLGSIMGAIKIKKNLNNKKLVEEKLERMRITNIANREAFKKREQEAHEKVEKARDEFVQNHNERMSELNEVIQKLTKSSKEIKDTNEEIDEDLKRINDELNDLLSMDSAITLESARESNSNVKTIILRNIDKAINLLEDKIKFYEGIIKTK